MAKRLFFNDVQKLHAGASEKLRGQGLLFVTRGLLESVVSSVAGYQGSPISHLMNVLADAQNILANCGSSPWAKPNTMRRKPPPWHVTPSVDVQAGPRP